ncbi:hypothetical protein STCU_00276 [Strigomonas culicis]|uniref:Cornichon protein n=1 Tax=Strigomonas culicis TaxID=28005 RepID=S9V1S1_9TRYP|nr:hypothetical protein STCU_03123 [Strigomonas culicis]EPY37022.1 hypothetical protein STCU_00276 [Strigomonas culicis]|eukprot:EPY31901.1 hypothetical protein STCU_03123 [Strigomonas culicis]
MRLLEYQKEVFETLRAPSKHSSVERKRAYMFVFVYILGLIAFAGCFFHFISGWIAIIIVQVVQTIMALIHAFNLNDYSEKTLSSMECERACNPIIDAYLAIGVIQILQAVMCGSNIMTVVYVLSLLYGVWRSQKGHLYVDATNLWRDVRKFEKEGYFLVGKEVIIVVLSLIVMVFSLVQRYSD